MPQCSPLGGAVVVLAFFSLFMTRAPPAHSPHQAASVSSVWELLRGSVAKSLLPTIRCHLAQAKTKVSVRIRVLGVHMSPKKKSVQSTTLLTMLWFKAAAASQAPPKSDSPPPASAAMETDADQTERASVQVKRAPKT